MPPSFLCTMRLRVWPSSTKHHQPASINKICTACEQVLHGISTTSPCVQRHNFKQAANCCSRTFLHLPSLPTHRLGRTVEVHPMTVGMMVSRTVIVVPGGSDCGCGLGVSLDRRPYPGLGRRTVNGDCLPNGYLRGHVLPRTVLHGADAAPGQTVQRPLTVVVRTGCLYGLK